MGTVAREQGARAVAEGVELLFPQKRHVLELRGIQRSCVQDIVNYHQLISYLEDIVAEPLMHAHLQHFD